MSNKTTAPPEETAVDDVRRVRDAIARQHNGNIDEHVKETSRIGRAWRAALIEVSDDADPNDLLRSFERILRTQL